LIAGPAFVADMPVKALSPLGRVSKRWTAAALQRKRS
jgi:hypothetical protein